MQVTDSFKPRDRAEWRAWLVDHHVTGREVWLLIDSPAAAPNVIYLDAVEEALCFGWIDGIQKRFSPTEVAQRFTPRTARSNWTELNKERVRRLIRLGLMTDAGRAVLPDLTPNGVVASDIVAALRAAPPAWANFKAFPELYRRVRVGYIEDGRRNPAEFARRLDNFIQKTAANRLFGNWNDGGRLA